MKLLCCLSDSKCMNSKGIEYYIQKPGLNGQTNMKGIMIFLLIVYANSKFKYLYFKAQIHDVFDKTKANSIISIHLLIITRIFAAGYLSNELKRISLLGQYFI